MKILFFLESLRSGGKERRLLELISFLKYNTDYEMQIVITESDIHYQYVYEIGIPVIIMKRWYFKKDPSIFFRFFYHSLKFRPTIIHSWAGMTTFYAIPTSLLLSIPIITNEITDSTPMESKETFQKFIWKINRNFSKRIVSNSYAGLKTYNVSLDEGIVIHNGIRMERFQNLPDKKLIRQQYGIASKYVVAMVASFEYNKDFKTYIKLSREMAKIRKDITFIAVGSGKDLEALQQDVKINGPSSFIFTGKLNNVEALINVCDFGFLLTNKNTHGEGISNSIMEFMAFKKPVIATDGGGTKELVTNNVTGFTVENIELDSIIEKCNFLLDNKDSCTEMGERAYQTIIDRFSLKKMGDSFIKVYNECLSN